jgi:hypothetical protein
MMEAVRRLALIVRPTRQYVEWANAVDGSSSSLSVEDARAHPSVYLVNAGHDDVLHDDRYLLEIFEAELEAWTTDESQWPRDRGPVTFYNWFDVMTADQLWDLDEQDSMFDDEVPGECAWCRRSLGEGDPVVTITIVRSPDAPLLQPGRVEMAVGGRVIAATVPVRDSESGRLGAGALILLCSEQCAARVRLALGRRQHATNS